jgi:hypothetical protein
VVPGGGCILCTFEDDKTAAFRVFCNSLLSVERCVHAVSTAGAGPFGGLDRWRRTAGGSLVDDDLTQILDAVFGEGGHAILTHTP